jgi:glycosyltransferase involved in cell wall biosynthesis
MRTELSVVIPVYNGGSVLPELINRLENVLQEDIYELEIILVNDGSKDNSWDRILELARTHKQLRGVDLMRNYGQHNALLCGIRLARHNIIITMDDDLQHPPEEIPKLLEKLAEGYDVVYGTPIKEQHGFWRDLGSQMTKLSMQSAIGIDIARKVGSFRAFRTNLRDAFASYQSPFVSIDVLLTWGTSRFASISVNHRMRLAGTSNYNIYKLIVHTLNMITGFSIMPLRLASMVGFCFTFFGFLVLIYVVISYSIRGAEVPGFAFLASIISIFSGAQLFSLGILGEYLSRMHFRLMAKPTYIIRTEIK